jgi:hypothetical protein
MFDQNDPIPELLDWGQPNWATEEAYDEDLGALLGELACGRDVPEAQTRGLAQRAIWDSDRLFAWHLAARLIADCPPANGLPDDMRRRLEKLAARGAAAPETSSPDPRE